MTNSIAVRIGTMTSRWVFMKNDRVSLTTACSHFYPLAVQNDAGHLISYLVCKLQAFHFIFFHHPTYHVRSSFPPLPPTVVVTQIRGHIAGSSPPIPTTVRALQFYREKISSPSSTRVELCSPTLGALSIWSFFIFANKSKISPRRDWKSRTNTTLYSSSIQGFPL